MKRARSLQTRGEARPTKEAKKPKAEKRGRSDNVLGRAAKKAKKSKAKRCQSDDAHVRMIQVQAERRQSDAHVRLTQGPGVRPDNASDAFKEALKEAIVKLESMKGHTLVPRLGLRTRKSKGAPEVLTMGSDCSGLGTERYALRLAGIKVSSKFASEINPRVADLYRKIHETSNDFIHRDVRKSPNRLHGSDYHVPVDLYVAGPPCQAWSSMGKRQGLADLKGRGIVFFDCLEYVRNSRPKVVVFENVIGLKKHFAMEFLDILTILKDQCHYDVTWEVINSKDYGVPQSRQRVYIVAIANECLEHKFSFPKKLRTWPSIEKFLDDDILKVKPFPPPLSETANRNINTQTEKLKKAGLNVDRQTCLIDVHASSKFSQATVGSSPCITATRGMQGGFYITNRQRMTNVKELGRLQGLPTTCVERMLRSGVAQKHVGHAAGNGMTVNVVLRLLPRALYSAGLLANKPQDKWKHADFTSNSENSKYKTLPDDMYKQQKL